MAKKIESGLQLFSRIAQRPPLEGINTFIFPHGPYPSQVIEITGEEGTGKTLLITDLLARCILPASHQGIQLPGKQCGALIINTNHHFHPFKLAELLQHYVRINCKTLTLSCIEGIVQESLKNLTVINCHTNTQLQATLLNLESVLLRETNISLLIVDTIAAFYWTERIHHNLSYSAYYTSVVSLLKKLTSEFGITVLYTKPVAAKDSGKKCTDIKILLKRRGADTFEMEITDYSDQHCSSLLYNIEKTINVLSMEQKRVR